MKKYLLIYGFGVLLTFAFSCSDSDSESTSLTDSTPETATSESGRHDLTDFTHGTVASTFVRAADVSFLPELESTGTLLYTGGVQQDMITTLKNAGCNTIRIRLWKNPASGHSTMDEVRTLAIRAKNAGHKVWLTVHYSDTWTDPGHQAIPAEWQGLTYTNLQAAVAEYTSEILTEIDPDIFQIGNEINDGLLWPLGKLSTQEAQCIGLLSAASATIRSQSPATKIMIHFAGITNSEWFFNKMNPVDYDYIGLSYYPIFHGSSLTALQTAINSLGAGHNKKVLIAETSYPFTLGYNDFTNNVVGLSNQLVPGYPATPQGQKDFILAIKNMLKTSSYGRGFSYWGGEWISFYGDQATNGSSWENQALYDFNNNALPGMDAFSLN